jgi:hypothetical protein
MEPPLIWKGACTLPASASNKGSDPAVADGAGVLTGVFVAVAVGVLVATAVAVRVLVAAGVLVRVGTVVDVAAGWAVRVGVEVTAGGWVGAGVDGGAEPSSCDTDVIADPLPAAGEPARTA